MVCKYNKTNHIMHLTSFVIPISVRFYCLTRSFVPDLKDKSVVPEVDQQHVN